MLVEPKTKVLVEPKTKVREVLTLPPYASLLMLSVFVVGWPLNPRSPYPRSSTNSLGRGERAGVKQGAEPGEGAPKSRREGTAAHMMMLGFSRAGRACTARAEAARSAERIMRVTSGLEY